MFFCGFQCATTAQQFSNQCCGVDSRTQLIYQVRDPTFNTFLVQTRALLQEHGAVVVAGFCNLEMVTAARREVEACTHRVLNLYKVEAGEHFGGLLQAKWDRAPDGWEGKPFTTYQRGWVRKFGSGRIFDDFIPSAVVALRESLRPLIAGLHEVLHSSLQLQTEKASVKCPGCDAAPLHLDKHRVGTYQVVIPLTQTSFTTVPGSHRQKFGEGEGKKHHGYYRLTKEEKNGLKVVEVHVKVGDVVVMIGGRVVHGQPAVVPGQPARIATYAHFDVIDDRPADA